MSARHDTLLGLAIIFGFIAFFFAAAIFGFDAGKALMYVILIPLGLAMLGAALLAAWVIVVNVLGRLLGAR